MALLRPPTYTLFPYTTLFRSLPWHSTVSGLFPVRVIVGGWVSTTLTVRVLVSELPFPSATVYVRVWLRMESAYTMLEAGVVLVRLPAQTSLAVAPGSVKLPWH